MLVSDIATRVKRSFGDETGAQITDADIIRWVNDAQKEVASANDLLQVMATTSTVVGQAEYSQPANLFAMNTVLYNNVKLIPLSLNDVNNNDLLSSTDTGTPTHFWSWSTAIYLYPTPSEVKTLKMFYSRAPVEVTVVGDTPELPLQYHPALVEYCLAQAAELDDNLGIYNLKKGEFDRRIQGMKDDFEWTERDVYPSISASQRDYGEAPYDYLGL